MKFTKTPMRVLIRSNGHYSIRDVWRLHDNLYVLNGKDYEAFVKLTSSGTSLEDAVD
jgi:hypothetical protein